MLTRVAVVPEPELDAPDAAISIEVTRVGLWSVARLAVVFWSCIGALIVTALALLSAILSSAGVISNVEHFVRDLTGVKSFHIMSNTVLASVALLVFIAVVVAVAMTVLAAAGYNALASLVGGVRCRGAGQPHP